MPRVNVTINREIAKEVQDGIFYQVLPEIEHEGQMLPSFTTVSPHKCSICSSALSANQYYDRVIITTFGNLIVPTTYWICTNPNCAKHHTDTIIGVTGSANYSDEYNEKMLSVRYNGRCQQRCKIPHLCRFKNRVPEGDILKIVSDEDDAIIGSVEMIFPNVSHSFCVFYQLKNVTKKYLDEFKGIN